MDENQLEEPLASKEYALSHESIKMKIDERYLELQEIDKNAEWRGIEESSKYNWMQSFAWPAQSFQDFE